MDPLTTPCLRLAVLWVVVKYVWVHYENSKIVSCDSVLVFSLLPLRHVSHFSRVLRLLTLSRHVFASDCVV